MFKFPHQFAPRVGLALDLTGKANTFLKLHYGRYYYNPGAGFGLPRSTARSTSAPSTPRRRLRLQGTAMTFKWNDPTLAPFNLNQLGAFVSGSQPSTATIAPGIKTPYMDEYTAFIEKQLTKTFSLRAGYVFRKTAPANFRIGPGPPVQPVHAMDHGGRSGHVRLEGRADRQGQYHVLLRHPQARDRFASGKPVASDQTARPPRSTAALISA